MSSVGLPVNRARWLLPVVYMGLIALTAVSVDGEGHSQGVLGVIFGSVVVLLAGRRLLQWPALMASMTLVILFVPIRSYSLPASLPINLEPYRLVVTFVVGIWLASSLIDRRVRFHRSGLIDRPLTVFLAIVLVSLIANISRVESVGSDAIKALLFLLSYVLVIYLVASVVRSQRDLDFQVDVLVYGGALVALACVLERQTQYNVFNHLSQFLPALNWDGVPTLNIDERGYRVLGSSQQPIAMGVALIMLVPLALYRAFATAPVAGMARGGRDGHGCNGDDLAHRDHRARRRRSHAGHPQASARAKAVAGSDSGAARGPPRDAGDDRDDHLLVLPVVRARRAAAERGRR